VNPGSLEPTVRFKRNNARKRFEDNIDMEIPISFHLRAVDGRTGELIPSAMAMTPRQNLWASVADDSFFPMQADCREALLTMLENPTEDNEAAAVKALKESGKFLANCLTHYQLSALDVQPQYPDQQSSESAQSQSTWRFDVPGSPQLKVSVKPINGLNCLPRGTPHMLYADVPEV
jgi:hypothetical protein